MSRGHKQTAVLVLVLLAGIAIGGMLQKPGFLKLPGGETPAQTGLEATTGISVQTAVPHVVEEATLFAFDNASIPFQRTPIPPGDSR